MKTRVTITLDPAVLQRAKSMARCRQISVSALMEELLRGTTNQATIRHTNFTRKWVGKFSLKEDRRDDLLEAMKASYRVKPRKPTPSDVG
jgi:hypothetical protein